MPANDLATREAKSFLASLEDCERTQRECLLARLVERNAESLYGREHGFAAIRTPEEYRARVPIVSYEDIRAWVDRAVGGEQGVLTAEPVRHFFTTSGSTAAPKFIPVTSTSIRDKWRTFQVWWNLLFERHPEAREGKIVTNFADSGGTQATPGGTPVSSESTFWSAWTARMRPADSSPLPREIADIDDFDLRYYTIARILLEEDVSLLMALNPSTVLLLLQKLDEHVDDLLRDVERGGIARPGVPEAVTTYIAERYRGNAPIADRLRAARRDAQPSLLASDLWPGLRLSATWRSPMLAPYLQLLTSHLGSVEQAEYVSVASEGVLAVPLAGRCGGGVPATSIQFYEFIPEDELERDQPRTLLAHEVEAGRRYGLVLTTSAGLYRYSIGDVVLVRGFEGTTPLIEFQHRAGATSSLTGEKLTEAQVTGAVTAAAESLGLQLESFTALPEPKPFPHYVLLAEFRGSAEATALAAFRQAFDDELSRHNVEYESKRESLRLGAPEVWRVEPGSYAAWKRRRVESGASADQVKPKHLSRDAAFKDEFRTLEKLRAD